MRCHTVVHALVILLGFPLGSLLFAPAGLAEEIFMTMDENGVTSFTDFPVPGARVIEIDPIIVNPEAALSSQERIEQQLAVARALQDSRLAREQARTERLAALAASQPQTIFYPVERNIGFWGSPGYGFWPGHRPPGSRPPRPPGHRPPGPSEPIAPGDPGGQPPSQSRPMPPNR